MKKALVFILIILILVGGGYFLFNYLSKPKLISSNSEPISVCIDTDGNNIYQKGYSDYTLPDGTKRGMEDVCDYSSTFSKSRVGVVREGYCDGNNFKTELWTCGKGFICRNGACIKSSKEVSVCSDSDGGQDITRRGEVYGYGGSGRDECWTSTNKANPELDGGYTQECSGENCYVYEYYCNGDSKAYSIISCSSCQNGVCS